MKSGRSLEPWQRWGFISNDANLVGRFGSYFVEPIIAGLKKPTTEGGEWKPYLASTDR